MRTRQFLHRKRNQPAEQILRQFNGLNKFHARNLDWKPRKGTPYDNSPTPQEFAQWLGNMFLSWSWGLDGSAGEPIPIPTFSLSESKAVVSTTLKFGRCADARGIWLRSWFTPGGAAVSTRHFQQDDCEQHIRFKMVPHCVQNAAKDRTFLKTK